MAEQDWEYCDECTGYGNDYYEDENGELVCACDTCWNNGEDEWDG